MSCARLYSLAVFKVTARDQGQYKGPLGAFVTYCNISCLLDFQRVMALANSDLFVHPSLGTIIALDRHLDKLYSILGNMYGIYFFGFFSSLDPKAQRELIGWEGSIACHCHPSTKSNDFFPDTTELIVTNFHT